MVALKDRVSAISSGVAGRNRAVSTATTRAYADMENGSKNSVGTVVGQFGCELVPRVIHIAG